MGAVNIPYLSLLAFYGILIIPAIISIVLKLELIRKMVVAVLRMTVQLSLIGLYMDLLFELNYWWLNALWLMIMMTVASGNIVKTAGVRFKVFFPSLLAGIAVGIFGTGALLLLTVRPDPFYDAAYMIPVMGMLLGNCMRGNILSIERFYASINDNRKEYVSYLMLGAARNEALAGFLRKAMIPALAPTLSTMTTLGIVSLPGMMTGQILGGSTPITAIKYQIAIMIAIFTAITISVVVNLKLSMNRTFDEYAMLKTDIFRAK